MNKSRFYKAIILGLVILNIALLLFLVLGRKKKSGPRDHPHNPEFALDRISTHFGFDESQVKLFEASKNKHKNSVNFLYLQLEETSKQYYLVESDEELRDSLLSIITNSNHNIYKSNTLHFDEIRKICTSEQLPKIDRFIQNLISNNSMMKQRKK